uniref:Uncharacterized protein n=1 Tax=Myoviridae sp. ctNYa18 TaxID=2825090 RepID=A0A8S5PH73_9CAUD|nr:MAG TPA: hypothetical protein [Myoviridae sp. ctNYa18]DAX48440.1 MAG TPA: hypothetical protein [Caudoviricetes sp.]
MVLSVSKYAPKNSCSELCYNNHRIADRKVRFLFGEIS